MLDKVEQPAGLQKFGMYINGASVGASNGKVMESLNPYSGSRGPPYLTAPGMTSTLRSPPPVQLSIMVPGAR